MKIPSFNFQFPNESGFTIIELLVVFSITTIISGLGFASFNTYNQKQTVLQTANNLKQLIDEARFNALSSVKPKFPTCTDSAEADNDTLYGYKIIFCEASGATCTNTEGGNYEERVLCGLNDSLIQTKHFPATVTLDVVNTTCKTLQYNTLTGAVSGAPCSIFIKNNNYTNEIDIDVNGYSSIQQ